MAYMDGVEETLRACELRLGAGVVDTAFGESAAGHSMGQQDIAGEWKHKRHCNCVSESSLRCNYQSHKKRGKHPKHESFVWLQLRIVLVGFMLKLAMTVAVAKPFSSGCVRNTSLEKESTQRNRTQRIFSQTWKFKIFKNA
eukprot:415833-Amphidinium_carterae.1